MIHHKPWTEMSYSQCHWRAADVAPGLLLSLLDGGGLPAGRQTERQSRQTRVLREGKQKQLNLD